MNSAQLRGVPIVSAEQMLKWLDGRNGFSFADISWNGTNLSFRVVAESVATVFRPSFPPHSMVTP